MTWVDDAKKKAQSEKQANIEERKRKNDAKELVQKKEVSRKLQIFHQHTDEPKKAIDQLLKIVREQGIKVKGPVEDYFPRSQFETNDDLLYTTKFVDMGGHEYNYDEYTVWGYQWTLIEPIKHEKYFLRLCLLSTRGILHPSIDPREIEADINRWLFDTYRDE